MSRGYIPVALREKVAAQARHRCGYCLSAQAIIGSPLEIDHLLPESLGGLTEETNLWLACSLCNDHKGNRVAAVDPLSGIKVQLFNPRRHKWNAHFSWNESGDRIVGSTAIGRATVVALNLNRPTLVQARRAWVLVGWHPPKD